jgi:predicted aspartyl protease
MAVMIASRRGAVAVLLVVLAAPAPAGADEVPAQAVVAEIPFAPSGGAQQVRIDVAPPGKPPLVMMLDTGSSTSTMTPGAARAAGVSVRRNKQDPYRRDTRLGRDVQFRVDARRSDTGGPTGFEYAALGGDFLSHYVVEIDFGAAQVRLLDPRRYSVPEAAAGADEAVVRFQLTSNRPLLEAEVDGRPVPVVLSTGMSNAVVLSGVAARAVGLDPEALPDGGRLDLYAIGSAPVRAHEAESIRVGGLELGGRRILVSPSGMFNAGSAQGDSVLGIEALSDAVIRVDYPRRRLWLRRLDR